MEELIRTLAIWAIPVVFAITLHEAAHGYVARYFGDDTAWRLGRISLNPIRHIDLMGTIVVPTLILVLGKLLGAGGILFGWAKPVPVDFARLHRPKQDMLWVAAAGPFANLLMAFAWATVIKILWDFPPDDFSEPLFEMAKAGVSINVALMALNLLPLPPLDGGRIVVSLLPLRAAIRFSQLERWGFPILLVLLFSGMLSPILMVPMRSIHAFIAFVFQFN